jgi:putative salt-induced outer membrane protein YdiY
MNFRTLLLRVTIAVVAPLPLIAPAAPAQDAERELGWAFEAELGALLTGGNQETYTLALDGKLEYVWPVSRFRFTGGGFTTESSLTTSVAIGTGQDDFELLEETNTEKTAEAYYSRARYDYNVSERFFLIGGTDWLRNTFAGIDSRFLLAAGAGNSWVDNGTIRFETDYAVTYTFEEEVVANPFTESKFAGLRLGYDLLWNLTASTDFESTLIGDWNLDNTDDIRLDWYNALPIDISSVLALKPSLRLLWRNDPALQAVPLFDTPGGTEGGTVLTPLKELDSFFNIALLFRF